MDIRSLADKTALALKGLPKIIKHHKIVVTVISAVTVMVMLMSVLLIKRNAVHVYVDGAEMDSFSTLSDEHDEWLNTTSVKVGENDKVEFDKTNIYIERAFNVTVNADGEAVTVTTTSDTVANLLAKAGVTLGEDDIVSMKLDYTVKTGVEIDIARVTSDKVVETETVEYKTVKEETNDLYIGQTEVKTKGVNGKIKHTYSVTYIDGKEESRKLVKSETVTEVVDKVVLVGTKEKPKVTTASTPTSYKKIIEMTATAYTYGNDGGNRTCFGERPYRGVVAVDKNVIPLGTKLYIETTNGKYVYGEAVAADTGMKGNRVDLFMESDSEVYNFGRRKVNVYILD